MPGVQVPGNFFEYFFGIRLLGLPMLLLHTRATQADSCLRGIHLALHMWTGLDEASFLRFYEPQSYVCVVRQR